MVTSPLKNFKFLKPKNRKIIGIGFLILLSLFFIIRSCSSRSETHSKVFFVACDNALASLQLPGKEKSLSAFSEDLIYGVNDETGLKIHFLTVNPGNLLPGLDYANYDGVLSTFAPNAVNENKYIFSKPYYALGPVLVVRSSYKVTSLEQMGGKTISIRSGSSAISKVENLPDVVIVPFENPNIALDNLEDGNVDGVVMDIWTAYTFIQNFHLGKLKIVTAPLTNEGIRLIARKEPRSDILIEDFNKGLEALQKSGAYDELLKKWGLINTEKPTTLTPTKAG